MRAVLVANTAYLVVVGLVLVSVPSLVFRDAGELSGGIARALGVAFTAAGFLGLQMLRHRRSRALVRTGLVTLCLLHAGLAIVLLVSAIRGHLTIIAPVIHALFAVASATYAWQSSRQREEHSHHGN